MTFIPYKIKDDENNSPVILEYKKNKNQNIINQRLDPIEVDLEHQIIRDLSDIGHYGTGDVEVKVESKDEIELAKQLIEKA
jgi:predicted transport protein